MKNRKRLFWAVSLLTAVFTAFAAMEEGILEITPNVAPGTYGDDVRLSFYQRDDGSALFFAVTIDSQNVPTRYFLADRELLLTAVKGEERSYVVHTRLQRGDNIVSESRFAYVIDKRSPMVPRFTLDGGRVRSGTTIGIETRNGAKAFVSQSGDRGFKEAYSIDLVCPADEVKIVTVYAFSMDSVGNASAVATATYQVYPESIPFSQEKSPGFIEDSKSQKTETPSIRVERDEGGATVYFDGITSESLKIGLAMSSETPAEDFFAIWTPKNGSIEFRIDIPYGSTATFYVHIAPDSSVASSPSIDPIRLELVNTMGDANTPTPGRPTIAQSASGATAVIAWDDIPEGHAVFFRVNGGEELRYSFAYAYQIPSEIQSITVEYREVNRSGVSSTTASISYTIVKPVRSVQLIGIADAAVTNASVRLQVPEGAIIRYELTQDGNIPKEPNSSSALMNGAIAFEGMQGKAVSYIIRYRTFASISADSSYSTERVLRFVIDKEPPREPRFKGFGSEEYSETDTIVEFEKGEDSIYFQIIKDGVQQGAYSLYTAPVPLAGAQDARVVYSVTAYSIDKAGNRSKANSTATVIIDKGSIYVSAIAKGSGKGTPDSPYSTLDEGIAAAVRQGKRAIYVKGDAIVKKTIDLESATLSIFGGCDDDWNWKRGNPSTISLLPDGKAVFVLRGSSLAVINVRLTLDSNANVQLFDAVDSSIKVVSSEVSLSSQRSADFAVIRGGSLDVSETSIAMGGALFSRMIIADDAQIVLSATRVKTIKPIANLALLSLNRSNLEITNSVILSTHANDAVIVDSNGGSVSILDSSITLSGGAGYARGLKNASGECVVYNSLIVIQWKGNSLALETSAASISCINATILLDSKDSSILRRVGGTLRFVNCILASLNSLRYAIHSDVPLSAASLIANNIIGFAAVAHASGTQVSVQDLNTANSKNDPRLSAYPNISEPIASTFDGPTKGSYEVKATSICATAGLPESYLKDPIAWDGTGMGRIGARL